MTTQLPATAGSRPDARLAQVQGGIVVAFGWIAICIGTLVLVVGWWFGVEVVASLIPGEVTMKANTAVGLILAGILLISCRRSSLRWLGFLAVALLLLVGGVTILEYAFESTWTGFDELLASDSLDAVGTVNPGRMGLNTAINYLLVGLAGLMLVGRGLASVRQTIGAIIVAIAFTAILGYALQVPLLAGFLLEVATRMALNTAIVHLLIGIGLVLALPGAGWAKVFSSDLAGGKIARRWIPPVLVVALLFGAGARTVVPSLGEDPLLAVQLALALASLGSCIALLVLATSVERIDEQRVETGNQLLAASEEKFAVGFEHSPIGNALVDREGNILSANTAFAQLIGGDWASVSSGNRGVWELFPASDRDEIRGLFDGKRTGAVTVTTTFQLSGHGVPVNVAGSVVVDPKLGPAVLLQAIDQRDQVASQEVLAERNISMEQFIAMAAHDLREPARQVVTFADILRQSRYRGDEGDVVTDEEALSYVVAAGERMLTMTRALQDLAGVDRARLDDEVDLKQCLVQASTEMGPLVAEEKAHVQMDLPPDLGEVLGSAALLTVALGHLIANGAKYHPPDRPNTVTVAAERTPAAVEISVADNGIGVDEADRDRMFAPFRRLRNVSETNPGIGIGLTVVRRIVERHHGVVEVESQLGVGTTVSIRLPTESFDDGADQDPAS